MNLMPHHCWHFDTHKVRLVISGIHFIPGIPRIISVPVYRKATGPFRFCQHPRAAKKLICALKYNKPPAPIYINLSQVQL
jgi:hypothetical protein